MSGQAYVNMDLLFPVLGHVGDRSRAYVPWDFIAPHEEQAQRNHGQTLKRLKERGGLSCCEMLDVLEGRGWNARPKMSAAEAWMGIFGHYRVFIEKRRAVNSHAELLRALKGLADAYAALCQETGKNYHESTGSKYAHARAAIASAESADPDHGGRDE